mmetsp:Transcript_30676/g.91798  ORF Transcript_30676/g.91798 Transcript_30676/m.91798 type:complete len:368 (+) Transcript_30676:763-1866(+)
MGRIQRRGEEVPAAIRGAARYRHTQDAQGRGGDSEAPGRVRAGGGGDGRGRVGIVSIELRRDAQGGILPRHRTDIYEIRESPAFVGEPESSSVRQYVPSPPSGDTHRSRRFVRSYQDRRCGRIVRFRSRDKIDTSIRVRPGTTDHVVQGVESYLRRRARRRPRGRPPIVSRVVRMARTRVGCLRRSSRPGGDIAVPAAAESDRRRGRDEGGADALSASRAGIARILSLGRGVEGIRIVDPECGDGRSEGRRRGRGGDRYHPVAQGRIGHVGAVLGVVVLGQLRVHIGGYEGSIQPLRTSSGRVLVDTTRGRFRRRTVAAIPPSSVDSIPGTARQIRLGVRVGIIERRILVPFEIYPAGALREGGATR